MAIPGQANINIGAENQVAGSDNLYEAFHTIQDNFTTLFNAASTLTTFRAGDGIEVSANASNGVVDITNTGVTKITAGTGVSISSGNGNVTISTVAQGQAGVTRVGLTSSTLNVGGVSGSNVVSSGTFTVDLPRVPTSSSFATGSYVAPNVTVDEFGRVTAIANGIGVGTVTSVGITPGNGISVTGGPITSSGAISVTNTGVTSLQAGTGIRLSGSNGDITISAAQVTSGTVTQVGLTSNTLDVSGTVTSSGTINVELPINLSSNNLILSGNANVTGNVNTYKLVSTFSNVQTDLTIGGGPSPGSLTFKTQNNSGNYVSLIPPVNTAVAGLVFMLPNTLGSTAQVLGTDGAGTLNWRIPPAAGTNTQVQFNEPASNGAPQLAGNANLTFNKTTGVLSTQQLSVTANATASRFISNVATGTAPLTVSSTTVVTNLNSQFAGTVTTAAQPNITSVGRLSGLTVGNATSNSVFANGTITTSDITSSNAFIVSNTSVIIFNTQANNSRFVALQPPDNIVTGQGLYASNGQPGGQDFMFWNLPNTLGNVNQFLTTDGLGTMRWANVSAGGGFDGANVVTISNTATSSTYTEGALKVSGGVGIGGNVIAGGYMMAERLVSFGDIYAETGVTSNSSISGKGISSYGTISATGNINSSSYVEGQYVKATSALYVYGTSNLGSVANITITGASANGQVLTSDINGQLSWATVSGGGGSSFDGSQQLTISNTNTSTSYITGAVRVAGGMGVAGNINSGGNIAALGNLTSTISSSSDTGNVSYSTYSGSFTNTAGQWLYSGVYYDGTNIIINEKYWKDPIGFAQVKSSIVSEKNFIVDPGGWGGFTITPSGNWVEQTMYGTGIWTITVVSTNPGGLPIGKLDAIGVDGVTLVTGGIVETKLVSATVIQTPRSGQVITNRISTSDAFVTVNTADPMYGVNRTVQFGGFGSSTISLDTSFSISSMGIIQSTTGNILLYPNILDSNDIITMSRATVSAKFITTTSTTYSTLSNQGTPVAGQRAFITDSDKVAEGNFGTVAGGGGSNGVPIYFDGSSWRIG